MDNDPIPLTPFLDQDDVAMDERAVAAAKNVEGQMTSWRSIEVHSRETYNFDDPNGNGPPTTTTYIETGLHQRLQDMRYPETADRNAKRFCDYADGGEFGSAIYESVNGTEVAKQVKYTTSFADEASIQITRRPSALSQLYFEHVPLFVHLAKAEHRGVGKRLGRDTDIFLIRGTKRYGPSPPGANVYAIDQETGWPLEVRSYSDDAQLAADRPLSIWSAQSLDKVGNYYYPKAAKDEFFHESSHKDAGKKNGEKTYEVLDIAFDRDYPVSMFHPTHEPGTVIWDEVQHKALTIPYPPGKEPKTESLTRTPIRAQAGWDSSSLLAPLGFAVGLACVVGAAILWKRR